VQELAQEQELEQGLVLEPGLVQELGLVQEPGLGAVQDPVLVLVWELALGQVLSWGLEAQALV